MRLADYMKCVLDTESADWHVIACGGTGGGPSYRYALENLTMYSGGHASSSLIASSHHMVAVLVADISISLAWGLKSNEEFQEDWANGFPDAHASSSFVDFFLQGALVYRALYVTVDGGRVALPLPDVGKDGALTVPRGYSKLVRLLNLLEGPYAEEYEEYLGQAGIVEAGEPWPRLAR